MACPGGCTNGGGQIVGSSGKTNVNNNTQQVNLLYDSASYVSPGWHAQLKDLYQQIISNPARKQLLHTSYHSIPKLDTGNPLAIKW